MDFETLLMGVINSRLTNKVAKYAQDYEHEDRRMPNSTRRAFESRMEGDAALARMAAQNMEDAKSMVHVAQTGVTSIKSQLQEIQKILTNCAYSNSFSRDLLDSCKESVKTHTKEIERLVQNTTFNGMSLLDGTAGEQGDGIVKLQAGYSTRDQKFTNLLDNTSGNPGAIDFSESNLNRDLASFSSQDGAKTALGIVEKYIESMQGLEAQYSYDIKSLDNLSLLFEEQADIYDKTRERSTQSKTATNSTNRADILAEILSSAGSSILDGVS